MFIGGHVDLAEEKSSVKRGFCFWDNHADVVEEKGVPRGVQTPKSKSRCFPVRKAVFIGLPRVSVQRLCGCPRSKARYGCQAPKRRVEASLGKDKIFVVILFFLRV
jgi:hypothetical protein